MKNSTSTFATTSSAANNKAASSAPPPTTTSSSSRQKRRQQDKDIHDGSDDYDIWTFTFKRKERNVQVSRWFREKTLDKGMMNGQLVYNIVAMPAFIFWHAGFPDMVNGNFGLIGQVFIACVMLVHLSFFALYWLDMRYNHLGLDTKHQTAREQVSHWRMAVLNFFVVTALSVNGLIMNTDIPATYNFPFSYRSKAAGLITFEPFVISCFLSVYHHHTYPISWEVVVFAWLVEFVLLVNSWVWICTPQSLVTNMVLTLVYACVLGVHHTMHVYKLDACLAELRSREAEEKVIGAYLAGQYPHSSSNTSYALSSVADTHITHVSGLTAGTDPVAEEQKSMLRAQRLEQKEKEPARAGLPHKRFLVKEQSLFE